MWQPRHDWWGGAKVIGSAASNGGLGGSTAGVRGWGWRA